ncbi:MAG: hypothetical protein ACP5HU_09455 [Phycisphaerae bacterium]
MTAPAFAQADEVRVGRLPYSGVTVTDFADGQLVFNTSGREITKDLAEVSRIELRGRGSFNRAEELLAEQQYAQAVEAYRQAEREAGSTLWLRRLISCRLVQALDRAGQFDEAVQQWLVVVLENDVAEQVLELRPSNIPPQGQPSNRRAIDLLELRVERVEDEALRLAIRELLLELYRREGLGDKAAELAGQMAEPQPQQPQQPGEDTPALTDRPGEGGQAGQLADIRDLLEQNRPERALEFARARMSRLSHDELPEAILLSGRARLALYEAQGRREQLLRAGLDFMCVATFHGDSEWAAEALYLAGEVNRILGNASAARSAWQMVIARYGQSEYAERAAGGIERLGGAGVTGGPVPGEGAEGTPGM